VTLLPSAVSTSGLAGRLLFTPDNASATVYGTETFVLFHPAAFAGVGVPQLSVGAFCRS